MNQELYNLLIESRSLIGRIDNKTQREIDHINKLNKYIISLSSQSKPSQSWNWDTMSYGRNGIKGLCGPKGY